MNTLTTIIDSAVATVIAKHPKLFDPKAIERAQRVLTREIMGSLTRTPGTDGEPAKPEPPPEPEPYERVLAADERGIAYVNLRIVARALSPQPIRLAGGDLNLPREASGPEVLPFSKMPPREQWLFVTDLAQMTAWREFFDATLPNLARRPFGEKHGDVVGILVPWPWPPSKTGKIYEPEAGDDT
jgi:hypothetical protein